MIKSLAAASIALCLSWHAAHAADWSKQSVNGTTFHPVSLQDGERSPLVLRAQVLLDRAHVSPGVIDGRMGENTRRGLAAYEEMHGQKPSGDLTKQVWQSLTAHQSGKALITYTLSKDDVDGPFIDKIPDSLQKMAKLDRMSYTSPAELLAAKFHMDKDLLKSLNKDADLSKAGTKITVANVRDDKPDGKVDHAEANKTREAVVVYGKDGKVIAYYPASVGSKELPSPSGNVKIEHIASNPKYYYHPELNFKGVPDKSFSVPPGPNNPVGVVWIGLSKPHYGIHGTPHPAKVGKTFSHGCVHLTNWDAKEFAQLMGVGDHVIFTDSDKPLPGLQEASGETTASGGQD